MTLLGRDRVCVGVKGGVLRAIICFRGLYVCEDLQSKRLSLSSPTVPTGRVQAHDEAYLRPVAEHAWRNY